MNPMKHIALLFTILYFPVNSLFSSVPDIQNQIEVNKALIEKYHTEGNKSQEAHYSNIVATLYWNIGALNDAVSYFERSSTLNENIGNKNAVRKINSFLGEIYTDLGEYDKSIAYYEKSLKSYEALGKNDEIMYIRYGIAVAFQQKGYYAESNIRAQKALEISLELNDYSVSSECYKLLADNYDKLGNKSKSNDFREKQKALEVLLQKQKLNKMELRTQQAEQLAISKDYQLQSAQDTIGEMMKLNREIRLQNELLNKEYELQKLKEQEQQAKLEAWKRVQRTRLISLGIVIGLLSLITLLILWQFRQKRRANKLLKEQNEQIEKQKNEIENQRDLAQKQKQKITDSIEYAQRIQSAILPPDAILKNSLDDYFILFRPKDIVSGDFYWASQKDEKLIIAAADCTGHGVPGAFMSMLGIAFLNEIVNKMAINKHISALNSDEILNTLRENVISSLHQTGEPTEPKDGMDIAICIIDLERKKIQFSGANNPLYLIRNGELIEYKADKMPVSYHQYRDVSFVRQEIDLKASDCLYIFSDGYIDQFGGDKGLKFYSRRFKDLLIANADKSMERQKEILNKTINEWMDKRAQLDDMLIIGIRPYGMKKKVVTGQAENWQSKTILIAEDTDVNYYLLVEVLKKTEANLVRVKDGLEAVEFIKNNDVDLILMDINMPNMNGYEATREIKNHKKTIPIIVQTAMSMENEHELALEAGADDYIAKPIDLKTFLGKISKLLS